MSSPQADLGLGVEAFTFAGASNTGPLPFKDVEKDLIQQLPPMIKWSYIAVTPSIKINTLYGMRYIAFGDDLGVFKNA